MAHSRCGIDRHFTPRLRRREWFALGGVTVIALVLRVIHLDSQLWYDEIVTVVNTIRIPIGELLTTYTWDNQHTLYSVLAQLSVAVFGDHAWSVRLPSVLLGTACIPALYLLGASVVSRREALAATALLALSYHAIWFSQNARGYTGLMLGAILATWLFLEQLRRPNWKVGLLYGVAVALTMYMHLTMVFVPVSHAVIAACRLARPLQGAAPLPQLLDAARPIGLAAVLTVALYLPMLDEVVAFHLSESEHQPSDWTSLRWAAVESLRVLVTGWGGAAVAVAGIFGGVGCLRLLRTNPVALAAFLLPGILGFVTILALGRHIWPRFFFFGLGFALIVFVHGLDTTLSLLVRRVANAPNLRQRRAILGLAVTLMCIASVFMLPRLYRIPKQDLRGALAFALEARGPREPVVVLGLATLPCMRFYKADCVEVSAAAELDELLSSDQTVWAIYTFPIHLRSRHPAIAERIDQDFVDVKSFPATVGGGEVVVAKSVRRPLASLRTTGTQHAAAAEESFRAARAPGAAPTYSKSSSR